MARFFDNLHRYGVVEKELKTQLSGAVVIDASNLSDYLYHNEAKGEWDLIRDLFNLAPRSISFLSNAEHPRIF